MTQHPSGKAPLQVTVPFPSKTPPSTTVAQDAITPFPAESGVLMFAYTAALPVGYLSTFTIQQVRTGQPIAGVPVQRSAVETLFAARNRVLSHVQAQSALFSAPANAAAHTLRHVGEREFDWARSEGLYCATTGIEPRTAKAVMQRIPHPIPMHMFEGISRLNMEAKRLSCYVLMFAHFDDEADAIRFRDVTSELFDVAVCEPDPAYPAAFSMRNSAVESGLLVGTQDIMVQVSEDNRRSHFSTEPFIATQVIDRVIWKMRSDGDSLTKIGIVVELNKSNVKRHLDKMRAPRQSDVNADWRKTYDGLFDIPPRGGRLFDIPPKD
ncbi:hypothetical protein NU688_16770 [Variovorax sp. ZS18.2.2]|uniref:hypothetical protein n=1 Tax=Variovorax sp. ZS18.2.2 TaxID=2971255 RepID=UPI002150FF83|nr:hypothetical protein [Variovorax sp. ZS18.2.2]MCR6477817.1 hypothetical protein [Variovorax sp. ZS18.2.2]